MATRAEFLTREITEANIAEAQFKRRFLGRLSSGFGNRFSNRFGIGSSGLSSVGGIGGSIQPRPSGLLSPTPRFTTPRPRFVAPTLDEGRVRGLTQEFAAPGRARLRRRLQEGLLQTRRDNPNLQSQLQKGLFTGFGEATAANLATAQQGAFQQANAELGLRFQEAQTNFQAALAERDRLQQQAFQAQQAGNQRAFEDAQSRLAQQERLITDQQDFMQQLERDENKFRNQLIRDILEGSPRATGTGNTLGGFEKLTFKTPEKKKEKPDESGFINDFAGAFS